MVIDFLNHFSDRRINVVAVEILRELFSSTEFWSLPIERRFSTHDKDPLKAVQDLRYFHFLNFAFLR
ncbi:hypothetical protein ATO2_11660 [Roseovarius sp. 22II1-1F6A]|nr:hypothetical protein ATO2_11660 [Roseovarius sp. 22II1-1F6A]